MRGRIRAGDHRCPTTPENCRPANDGLYRFLGGSPLAVAFRLILLSILVGVVLAAIGFDPWNILNSIRLLFRRLWDLGFDAINWLWRYFLLGAVIVIPIWLLSRLFGSAARALERCVRDVASVASNPRSRPRRSLPSPVRRWWRT